MDARIATVTMAAKYSLCLAAILASGVALPMAANASIIETFVWVPGTQTPENPTSADTTTPSGMLQLSFTSFALTTPTGNPNLGPYYTSSTSQTATITAFSYTAGDGLSVNLSNITASSEHLTTTWDTSAVVKPLNAASSGYYLVNAFSFSGTTSQGSAFMMANAAGTAGANYANGVGNGDNTFNATTGSPVIPAITDGGYWELQSVTTVPLPAALPLLLSGIGAIGAMARRRRSLVPA
jgi:PEP-CTERM motif